MKGMGGESEKRNRKKNSRKRRSKGNDADTSSDLSISESEEETERSRRKRSHRKPHKSRKLDYRSEEDSEEDSEYERRRKRKRRNKRKREKHERKGSKLDRKKKFAESDSSEDSRSSSNTDVDGQDRNVDTAQKLVQHILRKFPSVKLELKQLLKMLDDGQAVDIQGISSKSLLRFLKKLFQSLNLKKTGKGIYVLPKGASPCLEAVGSIIECDSRIAPEIKCKLQEDCLQDKENKNCDLQEGEDKDNDGNEASHVEAPGPKVHSPLSNKRRMIGPTMPSAEMLAAAAKLTEAEAALREAEEELEKGVLIGPPPPSAVAEAESANDAERFEEVTRIIALDASNPYEILGLNRTIPAESLKKRYWKLSLLVHPDKCSHPEAHQAFTRLNQAFKDLQDPTKRAAIDDKIIQREEKEEFEAELKASREAAQWRRLRGEARSGDDELLGSGDSAPKRDEWMTALPPERKPGVSMHSTFFSKSEKAERGDTSIWTDNPVEKAEKAKMHYLEAYKQAALTAGDDGIDCLEKKCSSAAAELMDNYNKSKRSLSLVEKHQQEKKKGSKKGKQSEKQHEEEWSGKHPWKPWDRETDLSAGRQAVNLDAKTSVEGLSSRFSSGNIERNFL